MAEPNRDALAAGLALGTLNAAEHAEAARIAAEDAQFAALVMDWEHRLAPLAEALEPVPPPPHIWDRLARQIGPPERVAETRAPPLARQIERLRQHLALWRVSALAAGAAATLLGALWLGDVALPLKPAATTAARYVALLNGKTGETGFLITVDAAARKFLIRTLTDEPPTEKAYELWLLQQDGSVPLTLGIIDRGAFVTLAMTARLAKMDWSHGTELAVSLETLQGAPSGLSMGPVIYAGAVIQQTR